MVFSFLFILYCLLIQMEAKVIMVHLLTNYQLTLSEGYKLEAIQLATLRPKHGVPCTLTPR